MKRPVLIAFAVSTTVGLMVAAAGSTPAAATDSSRATLQFRVQFSPFFFLDLGAPGPSMGDQIISHDLLFDAAGRQVGHDGVACTITDPDGGPEAQCTATFALPGGQLTTQFLNAPPPVKHFAVTGGTGAYRKARGDAVLVENGDGTGSLTFSLIW
jgi:allene oxide cyclase-like protein